MTYLSQSSIPTTLDSPFKHLHPISLPRNDVEHLMTAFVNLLSQNRPDSSPEIEIRIGRILSKSSLRRFSQTQSTSSLVRLSSEYQFDPHMPAQLFSNVLNFMLTTNYTHKSSNTLNLIHKKGRITVDANDPKRTLACVQKAKSSVTHDMSCPDSQFDLRISRSWEVHLDPREVVQTPLQLQRLLKRDSFSIPPFRLDMAQTMTRTGKSFTVPFRNLAYEIEIEIEDIDHLQKAFKNFQAHKHEEMESLIIEMFTIARFFQDFMSNGVHTPLVNQPRPSDSSQMHSHVQQSKQEKDRQQHSRIQREKTETLNTRFNYTPKPKQ
ncbi:putative mRNA capping enzyme, beta chain [Blattamonas nauphoetae]|uniref:mRNA 5'-phosphatase n=1 Tax=Blattamonas nauphoetae TaxID=2049346 RepID=A0ABQ9Y9Z7_9EUKA|nr:putative mRNA capping enzyme, beta chain [Blattamonas nauphoetae]